MSEHLGPDYGQIQPPYATGPLPSHGPGEDVVRGIIFAAAVIPLGIILWLVIWNLGVVASVVAWAIAAGAARLYALGAGHPTRRGVWAILLITVVTLVLAFIGGMWLDMVHQFGTNPMAALVDGDTWKIFGENLTQNRDLWKDYTVSILSALAFGALGCFFTLRRLFATTARA